MEDGGQTCTPWERRWLRTVLAVTALTALFAGLSYGGGLDLGLGSGAVRLRRQVERARNPGSVLPPRRLADFVAAVRGCKDFACLRAAHFAGTGGAKFLFPHFYIIGWQKAATTSLFEYLVGHPQVIEPAIKEPEFFTRDCHYDPRRCSAEDQRGYIAHTLQQRAAIASRMGAAACEASTHYAKSGEALAAGVRATFPWLKIVVSMREPISRAISMLVHKDSHAKGGGGGGRSCLGAGRGLMACVRYTLTDEAAHRMRGYGNYSYPLSHWVAAFPRNQILLLQYEHLTAEAHQGEVLLGVKRFLGLDPKGAGSRLGVYNARKDKIQAQGWPMLREDYEALVALVRPDGVAVARLLEESGLGDGPRFLANWESVWRRNLASCDDRGACTIQLS